MRSSTIAFRLSCYGLLLLGSCLVRLVVGSSSVGVSTGEVAEVILGLRAERLLVATAVGAALALSGVALQAMLRNPLAEPYLLGISTGAAAGMVVLPTALLLSGAGGVVVLSAGTGLGATAGAVGSMLVVFALERRNGSLDPLGVLLVGFVVSTINGALVLLAGHLAGPYVRDDLSRWMLGALGADAGSTPVILVAFGAVVALVLLVRQGPEMDIATLNAEEAASLGVGVKRFRLVQFVLAGGLAAAASPRRAPSRSSGSSPRTWDGC